MQGPSIQSHNAKYNVMIKLHDLKQPTAVIAASLLFCGLHASVSLADSLTYNPIIMAQTQNSQAGRPGSPPDLTPLAEILGVSVEQLRSALGGPPPDFAGAASSLGITEQALMNAMEQAGMQPPPRQKRR